MMRALFSTMVLTTAMSTAVLAFGNWEMSDAGHPELVEAHTAYLEGRYRDMQEHLHTMFLDGAATDVDRKNGLELVDGAFASLNGAALPVSWSIPTGVLGLGVRVERQVHAGLPQYSVTVQGELQALGTISQIRMVRHDGKVILDRVAGIGSFEEEVWQGTPEYKFRSDRTSEPFDDGMYDIQVRTIADAETNLFVFLNDASASTTPEMLQPEEGQTVASANPVLEVEGYRSPEYRSFEHRSLTIYVTEIIPSSEEWNFRWGYYKYDAGHQLVTVGRDPNGEGVSRLADGLYWLSLKAREHRKYGDVKVVRVSTLNREFTVKAGG